MDRFFGSGRWVSIRIFDGDMVVLVQNSRDTADEGWTVTPKQAGDILAILREIAYGKTAAKTH